MSKRLKSSLTAAVIFLGELQYYRGYCCIQDMEETSSLFKRFGSQTRNFLNLGAWSDFPSSHGIWRYFQRWFYWVQLRVKEELGWPYWYWHRLGFTTVSTTKSRLSDNFFWLTSCWYCPTPIDLGIDFNQFSKGVLQTTAIGNGRTFFNGQIWKLLTSKFTGRIDRSTTFI